MKKYQLEINEYSFLVQTIDLLGKMNVLIEKMQNPYLLTYLLESIDTVSSNSIENIHSTVDESITNIIIHEKNNMSPYVRYRETLKQSHIRLQQNEIIRVEDIQWINSSIRGVNASFRKTPINIKDATGNIVHQGVDAQKLPQKMSEVIKNINEDWNQNSIIKALLIHHQFEFLHPFTDGNGRTGRILFALLLTKFQVLNIPASVFSYSIMQEKSLYYQALQKADKGDLNFYILNMLKLFNKSLRLSIKFATEEIAEKNIILNYEEVLNSTSFKLVAKWCFAGIKVTNKYLSKKTKLNNKTVKKYIDKLVDLSIIEIVYNGKYKIYKNLVLEKLLKKYFKGI